MNTHKEQSRSSDHDELEIGVLIDTLLAEWKLVLMTALAVVVLTGIYLVAAQPYYRASILTQIEDDDVGSAAAGAAKSLLGGISSMFDVKSSGDTEIQIIGSQMIIGGAVDNLSLDVDAKPDYFPIIGRFIAHHGKTFGDGLWGYAWGTESIKAPVFEVPKADEGDKFKVTNLGSGRYRVTGGDLDQPFEGRLGEPKHINTSGGPITINVTDLESKPGVDSVLKRLSRIKTIDQIRKDMTIVEQGKNSGVILSTYDDIYPDRVAAIMNEIARLYVNQNLERKSEEADKSLKFLSSQIPGFKKQLEDSELRLNTVRAQQGSIDIDSEGKIALQESSDIETRKQALIQQRQALAVEFQPNSPQIESLDAQIAALNQQSLAAQQHIHSLPMAEQQIVSLMRDVEVNTGLYTGLLDNVEQLKLLKAGKIGNVRLIDPAVVPDESVKPKKLIIGIVAVLGGLVLGAAIAFVKEALFNGVNDASEIESNTSLSVYANVPHSDHQRRAESDNQKLLPLLSLTHPYEPTVESLRSFRTALQFALLEVESKIVLFTGPTPGIGKSFISANFASVMAQTGKKVLLIDGDMRRGHLHNYFSTTRGTGLSELIAGTASVSQVIQVGKDGRPDFISTGTPPPNPAELLLNTQVAETLNELNSKYDLIIVDTPPVLAAADSGILAPLVGAVFLIARAGQTKIGELAESQKRLAQAGVDIKGVILNGLKPRAGRYGYGSKYGAYKYMAYNYTPNAKDN